MHEATENELQGPGMKISKNSSRGPQSRLFWKKYLPSDFNVEVKVLMLKL
jgi:hypothetical protein